MLGCHDFCGYYDWTFAFMRAEFGEASLVELWSEAIGRESQQHYSAAGASTGLKGLYETWTKTGHDEHCDWTFTLDEAKNILRWDMRACPSKGFLIEHDLQADEDYCDHCMGWMVPLLERIGVEVVAHEHNHFGQCWGEMRHKRAASQSLELPIDIRRDPRWRRGYIDRFKNNTKLPLLNATRPDSCDVLRDWFSPPRDRTLIVADYRYAQQAHGDPMPSGVLLGHSTNVAPSVAARFHATAPMEQPLLMHAYLPGLPPVNFESAGLPRPVPILPLLIRSGQYVHQPGSPPQSLDAFVIMLANAVEWLVGDKRTIGGA